MASASSTVSSSVADRKAGFSSRGTEKGRDEQRPQSYWHHDGSAWIPSSKSLPSPLLTPQIDTKVVRLVSWNIDFQRPFGHKRIIAALQYLSTLVASTPKETPVVIFLQEMTPSDLMQIRETPWVQESFYTTDFDHNNWLDRTSYGTTTLIDRRLKVNGVFRVPWFSKFTRDGLFVDVLLSTSTEEKVLRLCNTHLESLVADPPVRPSQLQAAAARLHEAAAALIAGDFNAIQPFDRTLHSDNNLKDTYLELGGKEDSDEGYTWGYQVPAWMKKGYGCSRMDKILFAGALQPKLFERIGIDVKVAEEHRQAVRNAGELGWVTDHYGVMGDFELTDGLELSIDNDDVASLRSTSMFTE